MQPDDCKSLVETLSKVNNAKAKTTEALFRAEIQAAEERLRAEIVVSRAEAKADHLQLAGKVDTITKDHKRRLETLEEETETSNPNKHE